MYEDKEPTSDIIEVVTRYLTVFILTGTEVECPDGEYSETGYTPGCTSKYMLFYEE